MKNTVDIEKKVRESQREKSKMNKHIDLYYNEEMKQTKIYLEVSS